MPRPRIDFDTYLRAIPAHVGDLPPEAAIPLKHYFRSANDACNLLVYFERNLETASVYRASLERHLQNLRVMVLVGLIESFERFLKETAAVCIDQVGSLILDDRLDVFSSRGDTLAWHFSGGSLGSALCETLTWCDCDDANRRFRRILADPHTPGSFHVFPGDSQQPASLRGKYELMSILWQLRHTLVHNRGLLTTSDAHKLRMLTRNPEVVGPRKLVPSRGDVWYVRLFLDELAEMVNRDVGTRLAALLTTVHQRDPSVIDPASKAHEIASLFQQATTIAGETRSP